MIADGTVEQLYVVGLRSLMLPEFKSVMQAVTALEMTVIESGSRSVSVARILSNLLVSRTCPLAEVTPEPWKTQSR